MAAAGDRATDPTPISTDDLQGWTMAGHGCFKAAGGGVLESLGGPGLLWYPPEVFDDFILRIEWRVSANEDNSGVFFRFPPLGSTDPDTDWRPAVNNGYEVQIDERGYDPQERTTGSPLHRTGALYRLAPATVMASRPIGAWNLFEITARGRNISVLLNGTLVARLDRDVGRPPRGHIGLQNHHEGSRVQFRGLHVRRL